MGATDQIIARSNRTFVDALMLLSPVSVVATDDVSSVDSNGTVVIEVLANDRDAAGVLSGVYEVDALTQFGAAVTINGDNALAYDPSGSAALQALLPGETLDDTFKYSIRDASGRIDEGTVTVTVAGISVPGSPESRSRLDLADSEIDVADGSSSPIVGASPDLRALADAAAEALADEDDSDSGSLKVDVDRYVLALLAEERLGRE